MKRRSIIGIIAVLILAALAGPLAIALGADRGSAAFGDNETFGMNQLESASVSLEVGTNTLPVDTTLLAPGDQIVGTVEFANTGTLRLRYALTAEFSSTFDRSLLEVLQWRIWQASTNCSAAPVSGLLFSGVMLDEQIFGDVTIGPDPGDRLVRPGTSDTLCVEVTLPLGIEDVYQSADAVVNLIAVAEQAPEELG